MIFVIAEQVFLLVYM